MTVKATAFRKNLFRYLDECRDSGSSMYIQRGSDLFRLDPEGTRKPIGSAPPRPGIVDDLDSLPEFSPSEWQNT